MNQPRLESQPGFEKISYVDVKEVNYIADIESKGPAYVNFIESVNYPEANHKDHSHFDNIASQLQKRILKQGYVDKPSKIKKKSKKGESDVNFYNSSDVFIDDDECCIEKKDQITSYEDYSALSVSSLQELYSHPIYTKKIQDIIVETGKRKAPQQFSLAEGEEMQKFIQIKKHIKLNLLNRNKINNQTTKIENQLDKPEVKQKEPKNNISPIIIDDTPNEPISEVK